MAASFMILKNRAVTPTSLDPAQVIFKSLFSRSRYSAQIEAAALAFGDQLRIERAGPVARDLIRTDLLLSAF